MPKNYSFETNSLKIALALKGHSLASWARAHGYSVATVWTAVAGRRNGPKAIRIRAELEKFSRLTPAQVIAIKAAA